MNMKIIGENEDGVGVDVVDNNSVTHEITLEKETWDIVYHDQDGYPDDPTERTNEGNEHVNQARRFAKYHVYRERGYETIDPYSEADRIANPDRLLLATLVVGAMGIDRFEAHFGDYYRQLMSYHTDEAPIVDLPDEAATADLVRVEQDLFLDFDESDVEDFVTYLHESDALAALEAALECPRDLSGDADAFERLKAALQTVHADSNLDAYAEEIAALFVDSLSPLRVYWQRNGRKHVEHGPGSTPGVDHGPDARLQMIAGDWEIDSIESFQHYLVHHLRCQLRDCYVGMGLQPPTNARVKGPGIYTFANWCQHYDIYQSYHDQNATIDWDQLTPVPKAE